MIPWINNGKPWVADNSTMTGQGHEELHKYINLLLEEVHTMKGNDINLAKKVKLNLIEIISKYPLYFE